MMLSLTCITIVAAVALAGVNMLTEETIAAQKEASRLKAISDVLPAHERLAEAEQVGELTIYRAFGADDQYVGAAVQTIADGFGGKIKLMVGFDADNRIVNYAVLEQTETPEQSLRRQMEELRAHYAPQLRLYALALERVTGIRVRESLLCLISAGRNLEMEK